MHLHAHPLHTVIFKKMWLKKINKTWQTSYAPLQRPVQNKANVFPPIYWRLDWRLTQAGINTLILTFPILTSLQLHIPTTNTITCIYLDPILMQEFWCQGWGRGQEPGMMPDFQECGPVLCSHIPGKVLIRATTLIPSFSDPRWHCWRHPIAWWHSVELTHATSCPKSIGEMRAVVQGVFWQALRRGRMWGSKKEVQLTIIIASTKISRWQIHLGVISPRCC